MNQSIPSNAATKNNQIDGRLSIAPEAKNHCVHVAMLGARNHYAVPKLLNRAGMLGCFYTDIYSGDKAWGRKIFQSLPSSLRPHAIERLIGRWDKELPADRVVSFPCFGLTYWWKRRSMRHKQGLTRIHAEAAKAFNRLILRHGFTDADILYGYNGAVLELFQYAKEQGIPCILEQTLAPTAVMRALLKEELERWAGWEPSLSLDDSDDILEQREQVEWQLADLIIGGSSFVINGLTEKQVSKVKCRVIPYGVSLERFSLLKGKHLSPSPKLRILFAGEVGLRKGVPYLLEGLRILNSSQIEVRLAGPVVLSSARLQPYKMVATFLGPVPRTKMMDLYRWADLFVLPSICEGSALVTYEALACGLPVIATPNSGTLVRDEIDGLIVSIRDSEALARALERFASDPEFLRFCSNNALKHRYRVGLESYQERLLQAILDVARRPFGDASV